MEDTAKEPSLFVRCKNNRRICKHPSYETVPKVLPPVVEWLIIGK